MAPTGAPFCLSSIFTHPPTHICIASASLPPVPPLTRTLPQPRSVLHKPILALRLNVGVPLRVVPTQGRVAWHQHPARRGGGRHGQACLLQEKADHAQAQHGRALLAPPASLCCALRTYQGPCKPRRKTHPHPPSRTPPTHPPSSTTLRPAVLTGSPSWERRRPGCRPLGSPPTAGCY